ncbi:NAD(P)H:quinone oxidoreductase [Sulfurisphaera ohwakuensis]|uniref:NAD(P)H dehydrogenase (Quinone) n=1 Tax=Sulfurisphaera ohwakuensis TaxID=69656 RepID=A0A650CFP0_SULOH|nr:NAD(P)H:quinone oxidoreductase [Sulfurisphaera ohwakuensis]MBB5255230.1 NAD(P)H dehydrogenase (quinone) [Sulfurisphaera ohwakuensis]QGR16556.1 NAD(P)H:quinone oxidoreductase [Sulfurisphaera ohwakuensis]
MSCKPNILVLFYGYGSIVELAKEIGKGAEEAGAEVKIRRVRETLPPEFQSRLPFDKVKDIPEVTLDDMRWADGFAIGSPTRYGNMAGGLKTFLDTTAILWRDNVLYGKPVTFFTEASTVHGGHETTILTMSTYAYHFGMIIVPIGYGIPELFQTMTGGGPYGATHLGSKEELDEMERKIAKFQGKRITEVAKAIKCCNK